jgi:hypothetical protein
MLHLLFLHLEAPNIPYYGIIPERTVEALFYFLADRENVITQKLFFSPCYIYIPFMLSSPNPFSTIKQFDLEHSFSCIPCP